MLYFSIQNASPRWDEEGLRGGGCEMTISCSDHARIILESSLYWRKQCREFPMQSWTYRFRGRRSIWWGWWLTVHAPRNVNDVSCVTRINHGIHFAWQAQYLLRLEVDFACSAHWKWRFIWGADQSWDSFCVAGAVFGEVGVWLFVAGAALGDILGDSRSAKCCIFQYKIVFKVGRVRSPKRRVRDAIFWSDCRRIVVGLSSDCRRIVFLLAEAIHGVSAEVLNLQISWQAQYLVRLVADCACSAHCKWRFICDADQSWDSFCVAGAVFAEVGGWLCLLCAL